ncbi:MAG TPA: RNA polymerase sigma factor [Prosthecobacter sp.]|nr:RNA polymerase sigma factor [Prosthecobacter sp.]
MIETVQDATDSDLLRRYARRQDQSAFAQLVSRHQAMVMGVASRRTGDVDLARDVAQHVFVLLARKAAQLLRHGRLAGWLYRTASFEAAKLQQSENRRRSRQSEYAAMPAEDHACHEYWQILEEAMEALADSDREVIVMHYFEDLSYADMAASATLSEAAMRKRVSRALEHLSRQLQRRRASVSAVMLLTSATAMQTTVPVQASLAAAALVASSHVPAVAWLSWATLMTTNTALKSTAVVAILAALPVAWQAHENAGLRAEVAKLQQSQVPPQPQPVAAIARVDSLAPVDLTAARAKLQALREQRAQEEKRLASLQTQAAKLKNEVVVSLGRVDEVAAKFAEMQILALEMEQSEGQKEAQEKLVLKLMEGMSEVMPLMAEFRRISADPNLAARMAATTTAKVAGVSEQVRNEMERRLLRHYEQMNRNGLTLDRRPTVNRGDWDRRYREASAAAMRDIENLIPAALRETSTWKEGQLNFFDALFGGPSSPTPQPPAKTKP